MSVLEREIISVTATKDKAQTVGMTATIVSAYVGNNTLAVEELAPLIASVHSAIAALGEPAKAEPAPLVPAVPIKKSVTPDAIICLEDGRRLKMLKRHLRVTYGMTPEQYRAKWGLPRDYPMVAPAYAESRSQLAKEIGLGRKRPAPEEAPARKGARRGKAAEAQQPAAEAPARRRAPRRKAAAGEG